MRIRHLKRLTLIWHQATNNLSEYDIMKIRYLHLADINNKGTVEAFNRDFVPNRIGGYNHEQLISCLRFHNYFPRAPFVSCFYYPSTFYNISTVLRSSMRLNKSGVNSNPQSHHCGHDRFFKVFSRGSMVLRCLAVA